MSDDSMWYLCEKAGRKINEVLLRRGWLGDIPLILWRTLVRTWRVKGASFGCAKP